MEKMEKAPRLQTNELIWAREGELLYKCENDSNLHLTWTTYFGPILLQKHLGNFCFARRGVWRGKWRSETH